MNIRLIIFCLMTGLWAGPVRAQITGAFDVGSYTVRLGTDSLTRIMRFFKPEHENAYTHFQYYLPMVKMNFMLEQEAALIAQMWQAAQDSIYIDLRSCNIGYPLEYRDVLFHYIDAFTRSTAWQQAIKKNAKQPNLDLMHSLMLKENVYRPLDDILQGFGYAIAEFSTEKHGWVSADQLRLAGFKDNEKVSLPYIVWITVRKLPSVK